MRRRLSSRMRVGSRSAPRGLRMGAVGRTRCGGGVQGLRVPNTERRDDDSRYGDEKGCTVHRFIVKLHRSLHYLMCHLEADLEPGLPAAHHHGWHRPRDSARGIRSECTDRDRWEVARAQS